MLSVLAAVCMLAACNEKGNDFEWRPGGGGNKPGGDVSIYPMRSQLPGDTFDGTVTGMAEPENPDGTPISPELVLSLKTDIGTLYLSGNGRWWTGGFLLVDQQTYMLNYGESITVSGKAFEVQESQKIKYLELVVEEIEKN